MYIDPTTNIANRFDNSSIISTEQLGIDFIEELDADRLQTTNALEIFINELSMMFDVEHIDRALHKRITNADIYKTFIEDSLKNHSIVARYFQYEIAVKLAQGTRRDIMVVDITITKRYDIADDFVPIHKQFII